MLNWRGGHQREVLELGYAAVEGHLAAFEAGSGGATRAGLLPAHAETATGALAGSNAATLAQFATPSAGLGL